MVFSEPCRREDFGGLKAYGPGNARDVQQRDIPFASLDLSHVSAVYSRSVGQGFLGEPKRLPLRTDGLTQAQQFLLAVLLS